MKRQSRMPQFSAESRRRRGKCVAQKTGEGEARRGGVTTGSGSVAETTLPMMLLMLMLLSMMLLLLLLPSLLRSGAVRLVFSGFSLSVGVFTK